MQNNNLATITEAANLLGEHRSTLRGAIRGGHIKTITTAGGFIIVDLASARDWQKSPRKPGRRAKPAEI